MLPEDGFDQVADPAVLGLGGRGRGGVVEAAARHLGGWRLPVRSVAALSLAASFDLEGRRHTYEEMLHAMETPRALIEGASSEREFVALVLQTETRLVGENVNWFSRRAFTGVT